MSQVNYALYMDRPRRIKCSHCDDRQYVTLPVDTKGRCMFQEDSGVVQFHDLFPCPSCCPQDWKLPDPVGV
jgi:hypothetical protein